MVGRSNILDTKFIEGYLRLRLIFILSSRTNRQLSPVATNGQPLCKFIKCKYYINWFCFLNVSLVIYSRKILLIFGGVSLWELNYRVLIATKNYIFVNATIENCDELI